MEKSRKRLGEMLLEAKTIRIDQLEMALQHQKRWGGKIASVLLEIGISDEKTLASFLEKQSGWKCITLGDEQVSPEAINLIKPDTAKKYHIIPLDLKGKTLTIAISNPADCKTIDELSFLSGLNVKAFLAIDSSIDKAINNYYFGSTAKKKGS